MPRANKTSRTFVGPLHTQVRDMLRERILDLEWAPGRGMPNENELARETGVSVGTIRKALEALERERLIVRRQGRGTFVSDLGAEESAKKFSNLVWKNEKMNLSFECLRCDVEQPRAEDRVALQLSAGDEVIRLTRRCIISSVVRVVEYITVSRKQFPGLEEMDRSQLNTGILFGLYHYDYHIPVLRITRTVEAVSATQTIADLAMISPGAPMLKINRAASDASDQTVELSEGYVCLEDAKFVI